MHQLHMAFWGSWRRRMIPDKGSFSGHETFPFRHSWLPRGVQWVRAHDDFNDIEGLMASFGLGKNMVKSMRHWCLATQTVVPAEDDLGNNQKHLAPSDVGHHLFIGEENEPAWDPYLEDIGSLWLIHWFLANNWEKATTWYYAFNLLNRTEFSKISLEKELMEFAMSITTNRATKNTVSRDLDVFLRTYARPRKVNVKTIEESLSCPLVELELMRMQPEKGHYAFNRGPKDSLPDEIFAFAVGEFVRDITAKTVSFDDLCYGVGSPGKVFKLDEYSLLDMLERLAGLTKGAWNFTETAGVKQLLLLKKIKELNFLGSYYRRAMKAIAI